MRIWICGFLFLGIVVIGKAQNTRDVGTQRTPQAQYPASKKKKREFHLFRKKEKTEVELFRERVSKVYKEKAKEAKLAEKPQYSDPLYFGHKKPPKKRPVGKRKFCKECGLVH